MRQTLALACALTVVACTESLPRPTQAEVELARNDWPDASLEQLNRGRQLYVQSCAGCHALALPSEHEPGEWTSIVQTMRREEEVELRDDEADLILRYLSAVAATR